MSTTVLGNRSLGDDLTNLRNDDEYVDDLTLCMLISVVKLVKLADYSLLGPYRGEL